MRWQLQEFLVFGQRKLIPQRSQLCVEVTAKLVLIFSATIRIELTSVVKTKLHLEFSIEHDDPGLE